MSFNTSYILNQPKNELIIDGEFTVSLVGYHYFGATCGRANQTIADCSKFKSLNIEVSSEDNAPGQVHLVLYNTLGQTDGYPYDIPNQRSDSKVFKVIELEQHTKTVKDVKTYLANDYSFLSVGAIGVTVCFISPKVGSKIKIRVWGVN